ncbi:hypothetical protein [Phormidium tenue]|uniref:Uncharacterized protein n=1 Tax=Phormidium tenue NIES-30 TaxID=549789 RepID=A0A1U7J473_9CYAN|nr:hypothetical protein [Phormidium tenue]MBD2233005.1 hypothetical protein [Phormidium tenue FACHB-1052]OKH47172.1 hypothetical protein NIES30_14470 [Phormidium tenue NIES-30]
MNVLNSGFEIIRFSDSRYEKITVEIQYKEEQIAQINKDKGDDLVEIELLADFVDSDFSPKFFLNDFLNALNEARNLLENS